MSWLSRFPSIKMPEFVKSLFTATGKYSKKAYYRFIVVHTMLTLTVYLVCKSTPPVLDISVLGLWLGYAGYEGAMTHIDKNRIKITQDEKSNINTETDS